MRTIVVLLLTLLAAACRCPSDSSNPEATRATLLDGFESYSSPEQVKAKFESDSPWLITAESISPEGDRRTRFDWLSVSIKPYEHRAVIGELVLSFFNDRLCGTLFYPDAETQSAPAAIGDAHQERDLGAAQNRQPVLLYAESRSLTVGANTTALLLDGGGVGYFDGGLLEEYHRWMERYVADAANPSPHQTPPALARGRRR